jgi:hypothetical protein
MFLCLDYTGTRKNTCPRCEPGSALPQNGDGVPNNLLNEMKNRLSILEATLQNSEKNKLTKDYLLESIDILKKEIEQEIALSNYDRGAFSEAINARLSQMKIDWDKKISEVRTSSVEKNASVQKDIQVLQNALDQINKYCLTQDAMDLVKKTSQELLAILSEISNKMSDTKEAVTENDNLDSQDS